MMLDSSISAEAVRLAGIMLHYEGEQGECYPKIETLQRDLNVSKNTVLRLLVELEEYGFLSRAKRGKKNFYTLAPRYEKPVRPTAFQATGELEVQNAARPKPKPRKQLRRERAPLPLPLDTKPVPPVAPIEKARARKAAGKSDRDPAVDAKIIEALSAALVAVGVAPDDALSWATGCYDLPHEAVLAAVDIMRKKPAYYRREIGNHVGYIRRLVNTQVHTNEILREHAERNPPRPRSSPGSTETLGAVGSLASMGENALQPDLRAEKLPVSATLAVGDPVNARMLHARDLTDAPAWWREIADAMHERLSPAGFEMFFCPLRAEVIDGDRVVFVPLSYTIRMLRKLLGRDLDVELATLGFDGRIIVEDASETL